MIVLNAYGRFRLIDENGDDLTPKSMRARGLIALLAMTTDHCRSREWLQDMLWSDCAPKRGAQSLRQLLRAIRLSLGNHAEVLRADRLTVSLDPHHFRLAFETGKSQDADADRELFSGLAIPDREFEDWIRNQRTRHATGCAWNDDSVGSAGRARGNPAIFFRHVGASSGEGEGIVRSVLSLATASLLDFSDFQIFQEAEQQTFMRPEAPRYGIVVELAFNTGFAAQQLFVTMRDVSNGRVLWSRNFSIVVTSDLGDIEQIHTVSAEIVEAILSTFKTREEDLRIPECAAVLANRARGLIFRYDKRSLAEADRLLLLAYGYDPKPQYLAWRAFLRNMANFQHRSHSFLGDPIDFETLAREAIRQAPSSAIALGVGAHLEYLCGGSQRSSLHLARRAIGFDPLNAINHAILSNTELVTGNLADSRRSSLQALSLAGGSDYRSFMEFFCCMSAAAMADYDAAIDHAEAAIVLCPAFRAPLRYLVALYKYTGRSDHLQRAILRMRSAEPGFQVSHFLDSTYPVTTLRRMRLIEAIAG
ncbi:hypothetical protein [Rhizobium sp. BK251]|uniref:AfsR/SARP family transcriptional regulator n=1 Tax=Rhizobium sp. BK251 TaxID=2512125 RepID=UPI0010433A88|nr:hypothetical protein [Rhizobium sp. BK251]TCL63630.1 hypothetical protein EV286_11625 [Rhizobium sp. BK251]